MSFKKACRKRVTKSSKLSAELVAIQAVNEIDSQGNAVTGAKLTFRLPEGQEQAVLFSNGQRNLTKKIERFLSPSFGKFGQERYALPDWSTYTGTEDPIPDEAGLTMPELVVSALMYDASQTADLDPSNMLVHKMFSETVVDENGNTVFTTDWATEYACFIYVDEAGNELTPGFGHCEQPLKERNGNSQSARSSLREQLVARRVK
jgi:hypothetical protein